MSNFKTKYLLIVVVTAYIHFSCTEKNQQSIDTETSAPRSVENENRIGDYLFLNKIKYGPQLSKAPASFPFKHNRLPDKDSMQ